MTVTFAKTDLEPRTGGYPIYQFEGTCVELLTMLHISEYVGPNASLTEVIEFFRDQATQKDDELWWLQLDMVVGVWGCEQMVIASTGVTPTGVWE